MKTTKNKIEGDIIFNTSDNSMSQVINILNEFGIKKNSKIFLYTLREKREYYIIKLLNLMTDIDNNILNNYVNVCDTFQVYKKLVLDNKDITKFIEAYNKIINSNIYITEHSENLLSSSIWNDYVDYILLNYDDEKDASDIVIIYNFNDLVESSKYNKDEILSKFKNYNQKYHTRFFLF